MLLGDMKDHGIDITKKWLLLSLCVLICMGMSSFLFLLSSLFNLHFVDNLFFVAASADSSDMASIFFMLAVISTLWNIYYNQNRGFISKIPFYSASIGVVLLFISTFIPETIPIRINYMIFLQNLVFCLAVGFMAGGVMFSAISSLRLQDKEKFTISLGLSGSAVIFVSVAICFIMAFNNIPNYLKVFNSIIFFEDLTLGGMHILKLLFIFTTIVMYLLIMDYSGIKIRRFKRTINLLILFYVLCAMLTPITYLFFEMQDIFVLRIFSDYVKYLSLVPFSLCLLLFLSVRIHMNLKQYNDVSLFLSMIMFVFGYMLILTINHERLIIVHYKAFLASFILAFMGMCNVILHKHRDLHCREIDYNASIYSLYILFFSFMLRIIAYIDIYGAMESKHSVMHAIFGGDLGKILDILGTLGYLVSIGMLSYSVCSYCIRYRISLRTI